MSTPSLRPALSRAAFNRLSKVNQRKAIAQDVIDQLDTNEFKPETGTFLSFWHSRERITDSTTLRALYRTRDQSWFCKACALGSIVLSQLRVNGDCRLDEMSRSGSGSSISLTPMRQRKENAPFSPFLRRYFSTAQLQLIEMAFEQGKGWFKVRTALKLGEASIVMKEPAKTWLAAVKRFNLKVTKDQARAAVQFSPDEVDAKPRLVAIMQSIIANPKGEFVP